MHYNRRELTENVQRNPSGERNNPGALKKREGLVLLFPEGAADRTIGGGGHERNEGVSS